MTTCLTTSSVHDQADEQLLQALSQIVPEEGAHVVLVNRAGELWPPATDLTPSFSLAPALWSDIVARIDDGDDPVIASDAEGTIVVTVLERAVAGFGYALVSLPRRSRDAVLQNFDLIQLILGQLRILSTATQQTHWPS